jgi:phosphoacetylglucosamine mutase
VPTGVKYLHHAAQRYPIGVYFEANGHGTVVFSAAALSTLKNAEPHSPDEANAIKQLIAFSDLINQAVGDALSDMLLVETVLAHRGWGAQEWDAGYEDLPNRLVKVEVPDRGLFTTEDAERKLKTPGGLQGMIDDAVRKVDMGRSFVRPSGTEDCVRVYAEAKTTPEADGECPWKCFTSMTGMLMSRAGLASTVTDLVRHASNMN